MEGFSERDGDDQRSYAAETMSRLSSLLERYTFPPPIFNLENPIAFGTAELNYWS